MFILYVHYSQLILIFVDSCPVFNHHYATENKIFIFWESGKVNLLPQQKKEILDRWRTLIISSYPEQTSRFLARESDPFANPVGKAVNAMASAVIDELAEENVDLDRISEPLEYFVKIRAIQEFSASEAVVFILLLKEAVGAVVLPSSPAVSHYESILSLYRSIDRIALFTFDKYTECRENLQRIRISELKKSYLMSRQTSL